LDRTEHVRALAGLRRVNEVSVAIDCMVRPILALAHRTGLEQLRVLDVACGGGDVPIGVALAARRAGVTIHLTLTDRSEVALSQAKEAARAQGVDVQTVQSDAVAALPEGTFDVVTNSLFLHHLERPEVVRVLSHMRNAARAGGGAVVVNDLRRSHAGWLLAWIACRLLTKSAVVRFDGPASVRAAWTLDEMQAMTHEAGLTGAQVERSWPWRMMLVWERTETPQKSERQLQNAEAGA